MVIAAGIAGAADAIERTRASASLRGRDEVNLLLAGALSGFGPYVAVFLAEPNWAQEKIGFVGTAGGFAGLLKQLPSGARLDAIRSKQIAGALGAGIIAAAALTIAISPSFPLVLAALVLQAITGGLPGAYDCRHQPWPRWQRSARRATRTQSALRLHGRGICGRPHGFTANSLSYRAIFIVGAGVSPRKLSKTPGLLIFADCVFLFQMANASILPLAGEAFAYSKEGISSPIIAALIMVPQIIVAIMAPWAGRQANT